MQPAADARRLLAALANADARTVFAEIVLGREPGADVALSPARRTKALAVLAGAGLLEVHDAGPSPSADPSLRGGASPAAPPRLRADAFREALERFARVPRTGVDRYLRPDGRIDRYPAGHNERVELLAWIAARLLAPGERTAEGLLNARLTEFTGDVPMLRRYLVDYGLIDRAADGSAYWRADAP